MDEESNTYMEEEVDEGISSYSEDDFQIYEEIGDEFDYVEEDTEEVLEDDSMEECAEMVDESDDVLDATERILIETDDDFLKLDMLNFGVDEIRRCLFSSLDVAFNFYNWYAKVNGFAARKSTILRNKMGETLQQTFVCHKEGFRQDRGLTPDKRKRRRKPQTRCGCEAKIRVHIELPSKLWFVKWVEDDHSHELLHGFHARMVPGHRKMQDCDIMQMNSLRKAGIGAPDIFHSFASQSGGYLNVGFDKKNMYNQVGKQRRLRGSDGTSAIEYLRWLTLDDPLMFVRHTEDVDDRLEHVFWCDGRSQFDYEVFGDVLAFDATYGKNKYKCPVVIFSGVNNHNQTIVFAAAVIANEMEETYVWLLEQFSEAMKGKSPNAVITDGDMAMRNAIKRVFPNAYHRLCAWHLMRNVTSNVHNKKFQSEFENLMFGDHSIGQFRQKWSAIVSEFGLQHNKWVNDIYDKKEMWAAAYIRGTFFAGYRTTSRCEGLHSLLRKFVKPRYNLTEFVEHFQRLLHYMRYKEVDAEFRCVNEYPDLETKFRSLEKSGANIYTRAIFDKYRDVLWDLSITRVIDSRETVDHMIYKVVKYKVLTKVWCVSHYPKDDQLKCSCLNMETFGLPCVHIMAVLVHLHIGELPNCLVLERWTKAVKDRFVGIKPDDSSFWDSHVVARYVWLLNACREFCTLACQSAEDFNDARQKIMNEVQFLSEKNGKRVGTGGIESSVPGLKDPAYTRTKGRRKKKMSSTSLRTKRTTKCSACKVPGHNKLTCPVLRNCSEDVENEATGSPLTSEENVVSAESEDLYDESSG